ACSTPNPGFPEGGGGRHRAGGGARSPRRRPTGRALTSSPAPSWPPALDGSGATGGLWSRSRADGPLATGLPYRPEVGSVVGWEGSFCATQLSMTTGHLTSFLAQVLNKQKDYGGGVSALNGWGPHPCVLWKPPQTPLCGPVRRRCVACVNTSSYLHRVSMLSHY